MITITEHAAEQAEIQAGMREKPRADGSRPYRRPVRVYLAVMRVVPKRGDL